MLAAVKYPGEDWKLEQIDYDLKTYQKIVGGLIELIPNTHTSADMYCNEEGLILGLQKNFTIECNGFDIPIHGPVVMLGTCDDEGDSTELNAELFKETIEYLRGTNEN